MILCFGLFTTRGLMVDDVCPAETSGDDKARKEQRVPDQRGGGRRQRPLTCLINFILDYIEAHLQKNSKRV